MTGKVTGEDGAPLPGVSVLVKGTTIGAQTDLDGVYELNVPSAAQTLVFSFIGFRSLEQEIGNNTVINVELSQDIEALSEVVVIGYGEQSRRYQVQSVATVDAKKFENVPAVSPQQLLQGQAAGVQMTNSSGLLGAAANIRIRGAASITAGGEPLFVIDGVPLNDGDYTQAMGGASGLNPLYDINPNDIASLTVLKDASAVAIYGSRGANGVVLIETKKGQMGKATIDFDYYTGFSNPVDIYEPMNGDQFLEVRQAYADGDPSRTPPTDPGTRFNWLDAVKRTGSISNYSVSARGGSEKTTFFIGGTYLDQSGYALGNDLDKLNGRVNLEHRLNDKVKFGANFGISKSLNDRIGAENNTYASLTSAYLQTPLTPAYNDDGSYARGNFIPNIIALEEIGVTDQVNRRNTGNIYAQVQLIPGLSLKTDWGMDGVQVEYFNRDPDIVSPTGYAFKQIVQDNKWLTTNTLDYDREVGDHNFGLLLGQSYETSQYEDITVEGSGFASDQLRNIASAATPTTTSSTRTAWALSSWFARGNYRYLDRYMLEGSVRRDGSSRFGADNKYGTFWAVSGGWILSEESFMQDNGVFNYLKLTAGYGTAGNDRIGNFSSLGLYRAGPESDYAGLPGLRPVQPENPSLSWETSRSFDVGLDMSLLNSRLDLKVNYFYKNTDGLLLDVPIPYTTGYRTLTQNVGEMENKGWEFSVNSTNINRGDFRWTTGFNISFIKNKILSLPEGSSVDAEGRRIVGAGSQRAIEGHSLNSFYMIRYKGVNPETGDAEWLKKDGTPTTSPTADDRVIVGKGDPDFFGGLTNTFTYKGFELNAFLQFVSGNKLLLDELSFLEDVTLPYNKVTRMLNYWKQPGDRAFAPSMSSPTVTSFTQTSTLQLQNGSYMRLKNITLSYNLPAELLQKSNFISRARVYVMGQNLWTLQDKDFRGADPEISADGASNRFLGESFFAVPQAKTITFGVSLGF